MKSLVFSLGVCCVVFGFELQAQPASPGPVEIEDGIRYVRIHELASDLDDAAEGLREQATIIDLRFVAGDLEGAISLGSLLAQRAAGMGDADATLESPIPFDRPDQPRGSGMILVLVNHATSGAIETALAALQAAGDILLVGAATATGDAVPAFIVDAKPELEKVAYEAYENGTLVTDLLDATIDKPRFDEARLLERHVETNGNTLPPRPAPRSRNQTDSDAEETTDAPVRDRTLQRAVNTIRAARALGRLDP